MYYLVKCLLRETGDQAERILAAVRVQRAKISKIAVGSGKTRLSLWVSQKFLAKLSGSSDQDGTWVYGNRLLILNKITSHFLGIGCNFFILS